MKTSNLYNMFHCSFQCFRWQTWIELGSSSKHGFFSQKQRYPNLASLISFCTELQLGFHSWTASLFCGSVPLPVSCFPRGRNGVAKRHATGHGAATCGRWRWWWATRCCKLFQWREGCRRSPRRLGLEQDLCISYQSSGAHPRCQSRSLRFCWFERCWFWDHFFGRVQKSVFFFWFEFEGYALVCFDSWCVHSQLCVFLPKCHFDLWHFSPFDLRIPLLGHCDHSGAVHPDCGFPHWGTAYFPRAWSWCSHHQVQRQRVIGSRKARKTGGDRVDRSWDWIDWTRWTGNCMMLPDLCTIYVYLFKYLNLYVNIKIYYLCNYRCF